LHKVPQKVEFVSTLIVPVWQQLLVPRVSADGPMQSVDLAVRRVCVAPNPMSLGGGERQTLTQDVLHVALCAHQRNGYRYIRQITEWSPLHLFSQIEHAPQILPVVALADQRQPSFV
jgi:hypothetical protein